MRLGALVALASLMGAGCALQSSGRAARLTAAPAPVPQDSARSGTSQVEELARRATDPTSSPTSLAFINVFTTSYEDAADGAPVDENGYDLRFQPVIPFAAWGRPNILRFTLPYTVSGSGNSGLGDVTVFDLVVFPQSWGRFAVGAVASLASRTSDAPRFKAGPAIGVVVPASKRLNLGLFNQNLFATDVAISQLQPIAAYQLGQGWSLSLGDLQFPYDWHTGKLLAAPIGLQLGKVVPVAKQPMRFSVNPQYDLKPQPGAGRFSIQATIQLIIPGQ